MSRLSKPAQARQESDDADGVDIDAGFRRVFSTAATAGVTKPAGAVASVFEAGKRAKPPKKPRVFAPVIDLAAVQIEDDVPIPSVKGPNPVRVANELLLERLLPGQSVLLLTQQARSLRAAAKRLKLPVVCRVETTSHTRVWRLRGVLAKAAP
jgi:hypothetical protein